MNGCQCNGGDVCRRHEAQAEARAEARSAALSEREIDDRENRYEAALWGDR